MSRLVIVSNRVALPHEQRAGGLAVAMRAALKEFGGLWFGWSGKRVRDEPSGRMHEIKDGNTTYATMDLSYEDFDGYYNGFSNRTLWPLLHFRLDLVDYRRDTYDDYRRVNSLFAEKLAKQLRPDDVVWVHDYHMIPLAQRLRELGVANRIGFFLHVPMPSSDLLAAMPNHEQLFSSLAAYDLVGFQTERDLDRFQSYVRLYRGGKVYADGRLRMQDGREFRAGAFPISIDTGMIARQAAAAVSRASVQRLRDSLGSRVLAIGVDRLDYSKGLPDRFRAFERLLESYPELHGQITYLQLAPVSRVEVPEYQALRRELEGLAGHINGRHAAPEWTPVRYVNRDFSHGVLTGFYRSADIGLVTPLRDGMNLVAKEFVASQDPEKPGVLVLSRFAGAAAEMHEALIVNPYDLDGVADALAQAHAMPMDERKERWHALHKRLQKHDITLWRRKFLEALAA
ncbi:alpha,alpha-trehalose-phosphate synthase (UDP-forming) [Lysobacter helvus]|uniref:Trehalose-6-phosphate synthase n=2 Tax=Lysobacteraceae TaxID=32033 RepID=A0ABM7Q505_9GAMM|nr:MULTISPECIES: alpha,alpha-trehalose-phosphate synthase (UDP-forming) [Lysobacter]BCT92334.1 alpha,alpha-trehalose-phosphate synthase (UDP-forming) [Lysobacter caseinilyticus]BCT95487.1 alpha,alpha-trehalose-phosphate synthase (UDP-forming) [Lysobacter helvus]